MFNLANGTLKTYTSHFTQSVSIFLIQRFKTSNSSHNEIKCLMYWMGLSKLSNSFCLSQLFSSRVQKTLKICMFFNPSIQISHNISIGPQVIFYFIQFPSQYSRHILFFKLSCTLTFLRYGNGNGRVFYFIHSNFHDKKCP